MEKFRMYGFVPFNISEIQKGIQFGHAVVEYGLTYGTTDEYKHWANHDKTFIILNGGTTRYVYFDMRAPGMQPGAMNQIVETLTDMKIKFSTFHEPDLNYALTAIVFLVPDKVFDKETYPDFDFGADFLDDEKAYEEGWHKKWLESIGGETNELLRKFLSKYRLA